MTDIIEVLRQIAGIVTAIALLLTPVVTLWLGRREQRNKRDEADTKLRLEEQRGEVDDLLDFSNAAKLQGDSWQVLVANLRIDFDRLKEQAAAREASLLAELQALKGQLQDNKSRLDSVMESDMVKSKELEQKLNLVTAENLDLRSKLVDVEGENIRLQTELNETRDEVQQLRVENDQLREALRLVQNDVRAIKKQTGELKRQERGHDTA